MGITDYTSLRQYAKKDIDFRGYRGLTKKQQQIKLKEWLAENILSSWTEVKRGAKGRLSLALWGQMERDMPSPRPERVLRRWTVADLRTLRSDRKKHVPIRETARKLSRSYDSVRLKRQRQAKGTTG